MIRRFASGVVLLILWIVFSGCSDKGGNKNPDGKTTGRPPLAVDVIKAVKTDFTEALSTILPKE